MSKPSGDKNRSDFDVVVVGGGHAGVEAAHAAARIGVRVALITLNPDKIGFMSCNPAMGGLAKGQLIKEIDALGGLMGRITDRAAIQYKVLNSSKGAAVRSSRAQCDKYLYAREMQAELAKHPITIMSGEVSDVIIDHYAISGVLLKDGSSIRTRALIVTSGTFLQAKMFTGFKSEVGGRVGDPAACGLSNSLSALGFRLRRLKTGTPPRLHRRSIPFEKLEAQWGDENPIPFSFYEMPEKFPRLRQVACHITYTNEKTHEIIERNFARSPMFSGLIQGVGPRYCPSIEDKVKRFRDRSRHQIFLEPEGLDTDEIYVNGISTSLPEDVQDEFVHSIVGLENAEFIRYGYAVEYDSVDSRQLKTTFESKDVLGLFFAGQVNGTSGYEEAGAQGIIAGINAAQIVLGRDPFRLGRNEAYIGVLADDLSLVGSDEPYRMFTSRAEYRLLLREDNADLRLGRRAFEIGLLSKEQYAMLEEKSKKIEKLREKVEGFYVYPTAKTNAWFEGRGYALLKDRTNGSGLLRRPQFGWEELEALGFVDELEIENTRARDSIREQVLIQVKYEGYIQRDVDLLKAVIQSENVKIPTRFDYSFVPGLSLEVRTRLSETRPETLGQASRIQGVTPAAVANLMIYLKIKDKRNA